MNEKYHIKQLLSFENIENHFEKFGQTDKILVYEKNNKNFIIDGIKRYIFFKNNCEKAVFHNLLDCYNYFLIKTKTSESQIITIIKNLVEENYSIEEIFNCFGKKLSVSLRDLDKISKIKVWNDNLQRIALKFDMSISEIKNYYLLNEKDFIDLFNFYDYFDFNSNHRRDIFVLIDEIAKKDNLSFNQIFEYTKEIKDSELQNSDKINKIKALLHKIRFPEYYSENNRILELKPKFKAIGGLIVDIPFEKESKNININFKIQNIEELLKKIESLTKLSNDEIFKEITKIIEKR